MSDPMRDARIQELITALIPSIPEGHTFGLEIRRPESGMPVIQQSIEEGTLTRCRACGDRKTDQPDAEDPDAIVYCQGCGDKSCLQDREEPRWSY